MKKMLKIFSCGKSTMNLLTLRFKQFPPQNINSRLLKFHLVSKALGAQKMYQWNSLDYDFRIFEF